MTDSNHYSVPAKFKAAVARWGDRIAMRKKEFGLWHDITWNDYDYHVSCVAYGLMAMGLQKGDCARREMRRYGSGLMVAPLPGGGNGRGHGRASFQDAVDEFGIGTGRLFGGVIKVLGEETQELSREGIVVAGEAQQHLLVECRGSRNL